jgi:hypothetical protein
VRNRHLPHRHKFAVSYRIVWAEPQCIFSRIVSIDFLGFVFLTLPAAFVFSYWISTANMAAAPANFTAEEADNLEDVSAQNFRGCMIQTLTTEWFCRLRSSLP